MALCEECLPLGECELKKNFKGVARLIHSGSESRKRNPENIAWLTDVRVNSELRQARSEALPYKLERGCTEF